MLIYGGNILGEVYIYEVLNIGEAFSIEDDAPPKAELKLIDMILTEEPFQIRQMKKIGDGGIFALCSEADTLQIVKHDPQL